MDDHIKDRLIQRNRELMEIVLEKIQTEYREDIDLVGVKGSFFTGDFHEHSDLDWLIVVNNDHGYGLARCFILDGVGFDVYGQPWNSLERLLVSQDYPSLSRLIDVDVVYVRNLDCEARFRDLHRQALQLLDAPVTLQMVRNAAQRLAQAVLAYGNLMLAEDLGGAWPYAGRLLRHASDTVCIVNHTYLKLGVKRLLGEILAMGRIPEHFREGFHGVVSASSLPQLQEAATTLLRSVKKWLDEIRKETPNDVVPTQGVLNGTYEEIWCNWRNKVRYAAEHDDAFLALASGVNCQEFYDEMHEAHDTVAINLMLHFDPQDLPAFARAFDQAMAVYRQEYDRLNMDPWVYDSVGAFRRDYLDRHS